MRVALCFSGFIRDLEESKVFWTELINKYNIDVYASFWDTENEELGDTLKNFLRIYTPKKYEVERYDVFKSTTQDFASMNIQSPQSLAPMFQTTSKAFGQLSMYYKVWRCNSLTKELGIQYDLVIRARTDTVLDEDFELIDNNMLNLPIGNVHSHWPNSEGLNDCFAYANSKIMDYYSFIFLQMMEYLKAGHYLFPPEHFLKVHFSKIKIQIRYFANYMMITRVSKGAENEMFNRFVSEADWKETIVWSDEKQYLPNPDGNFKKDIIDDFII
jgi:hypothetical protein